MQGKHFIHIAGFHLRLKVGAFNQHSCNMADGKIEVITYSGYKGEESPRFFILDSKKIEVIEILKMWIEEDASRARKRFFKIKGSDGYIHTLYYDEKLMNWFLC